jgi:hypothetical protein
MIRVLSLGFEDGFEGQLLEQEVVDGFDKARHS